MSDQRDGLNGALDGEATGGRGGIDSLKEAAREAVRAVGEAAEPGGSTPLPFVDRSSGSSQAEERDRPGAETIAPRRVQSDDSSRPGRLLSAFHAPSIRTLLIGGALFAIVTVVLVASVASHDGSSPDAVVQGCVAHDFGAEATVVVTNHGSGTASYVFDVVFAQNQSAVAGVPAQVKALRTGASQTFHAYSGSLDTSRAFTCTLANVQRLAG